MRTSPFVSADARSGFHCGKDALDFFFHRLARGNGSKGLNKTFVRRRTDEDPSDWPTILGFYSLTAASVGSDALPSDAIHGIPNHYDIPVALIGRLAVDRRVQGHGLGRELLTDAEQRVLQLAEQIGILAVIVDAKDDDAERFYQRAGYDLLAEQSDWPKRMFVTLRDLRETPVD